MALRARVVLDDCRFAHQQLDSVLEEQRFRVYWAASCALLRAVGHVLESIDASSSPEASTAIKAAWSRWSSDRDRHAIFWEFIKAERDLVLKEYEHRFVLGQHMIIHEGSKPGEPEYEMIGPEYYIPMAEGRFEGEDCRELVRDAINWWDEELSAIEAEISGPGGLSG